MASEQTIILVLMLTAAQIGVLHTLIGPDHYLPFVALAKCRNWSYIKTLFITFVCGLAHTLSSVIIGAIGIFIGASAGVLEEIEGSRADIVKWLLLGFALAYVIYGLKRALGKDYLHSHADGTVHSHRGLFGHSHSHKLSNDANFWLMFLIFAFGPCEALIPMVMEPASRADWGGVIAIFIVFSAATIFTMLAMVSLLTFGLGKFNFPVEFFKRWGSALTGLVILVCSILMFVGL